MLFCVSHRSAHSLTHTHSHTMYEIFNSLFAESVFFFLFCYVCYVRLHICIQIQPFRATATICLVCMFVCASVLEPVRPGAEHTRMHPEAHQAKHTRKTCVHAHAIAHATVHKHCGVLRGFCGDARRNHICAYSNLFEPLVISSVCIGECVCVFVV